MTKSNLRDFDYRRVAKLDNDMWRAYYNHRFLKMFTLLLRLIRTQLHLNWFLTFRAAYYSALAATNYRLKKGHEDYKKAAELELRWWDVHRYPSKYQQSLVNSLAKGMAVIYNVKPEILQEYARYRAEAMLLPKHNGDKQKNPPDWHQIETLLIKAWHSAHQSLQK